VAPKLVSQLAKNTGVSCLQQGCLASRRRVLQIAWQLVKGSKGMEVTGREIATIGRMVHN